MMHVSQRVAEVRGEKAARAGLPITENPYKRTAKSYWSFERGFRRAALASPANEPAK